MVAGEDTADPVKALKSKILYDKLLIWGLSQLKPSGWIKKDHPHKY